MSDTFEIDPSDLRAFREATREDVRRLFTEFQQEFPRERFYVFGLFDYVDWSFPSLFYGASTLQHWKAALSQKDDSTVDLPDEYYKWAAGQWKCNGNLSSMSIVEEIIAKTGIDDLDPYDGELDTAREVLQYSVEVEMMLALRELDTEHFFGQGEKRNAFLLTVSTEDEGAASDWKHEVSGCLLNPDDVFRKFLVEFRRGNREELPDIDAQIQQLKDTELAQRFYERLAS